MGDPDRPTDAATRAVLGIPELLERLEVDSAPGRGLLSSLEWYGPSEESRWRREMSALEAVERWSEEAPDSHRVVRRHLSELPELRAVLEGLEGGQVLGEGELFELKRFGFFGRRILDAAGQLAGELGAADAWRHQLDALVALVHPGGEDSPQFHLSGALDEEFREALERRRRLEGEVRERRREIEADVVAELGGSFDWQGRYRPPESGTSEELEARPDLRSTAAGWRAHSGELEELEEDFAEAKRELDAEERRVRAALTEELRDRDLPLAEMEAFLARLDVRLAKIRLKREIDGCWARWQRSASAPFALEAGREPRIERRAGEEGGAIQPVDLEAGARPSVVTGPNMGGKSALLMLLGLCQWCAQRALPVPAGDFRFTPVEAIVYVGSEEPNAVDASQGLSSFGREVRRLAHWMERAEPGALWLLDEIGRGTNPEDGAAIAGELVERLHARGDLVLAATHFPELAASDSVDHLQIRGIVAREQLEEELAGVESLEEIEGALRDAMDFQPEPAERGDVSTDARLVARALGLSLADEG